MSPEILDYAIRDLGLERNALLQVSLLSSAVAVPIIYLSGRISDVVGRRPQMIAGATLLTAWTFPFFWLIETGAVPAIAVALIVGVGIGAAMIYGPAAASIAEMFEPRVRYSGASIAYQIAAILVTGGTPFLTTALLAGTGSTTGVSAFVMVMALVTLICTCLMSETASVGGSRTPSRPDHVEA